MISTYYMSIAKTACANVGQRIWLELEKKKNFKHQTILYELNLNDQFKSAKYTENILT